MADKSDFTFSGVSAITVTTYITKNASKRPENSFKLLVEREYGDINKSTAPYAIHKKNNQ